MPVLTHTTSILRAACAACCTQCHSFTMLCHPRHGDAGTTAQHRIAQYKWIIQNRSSVRCHRSSTFFCVSRGCSTRYRIMKMSPSCMFTSSTLLHKSQDTHNSQSERNAPFLYLEGANSNTDAREHKGVEVWTRHHHLLVESPLLLRQRGQECFEHVAIECLLVSMSYRVSNRKEPRRTCGHTQVHALRAFVAAPESRAGKTQGPQAEKG